MPRILTICPYPLLPLRGGGGLRCFHLLRQLARHHEVHAVIFQDEAELRRDKEGYQLPDNVTLHSPIDKKPPKSLFDRLPRRIGPALHYRWLRRSWSGPAEGTLLACQHLLCRIVKEHAIDAVVFEHLQTMKAAPLLRRLSPASKLILDAHNVDHLLFAAEMEKEGFQPSAAGLGLIRRTAWEECHLDRFVDAVWCCSEQDRQKLATPSGIPGYLIPNGVDCSFFEYDDSMLKADSPYLLFSGAMQTEANKDAVRWLIRDIWPRLLDRHPGLRLLLVGGGMPDELAAEAVKAPAVEVVGEVPDVRPYFRKASLALVPLRIGSGTRLKIMEAMAQGNPVVSTTKGAEGLDLRHGENILLADAAESFAALAADLLDDAARFERIGRNARGFVENRYNWDIIGHSATEAINEIISP